MAYKLGGLEKVIISLSFKYVKWKKENHTGIQWGLFIDWNFLYPSHLPEQFLG